MERVYHYYIKRLTNDHFMATYPGLDGFEPVIAGSLRKVKKKLYRALASHLLQLQKRGITPPKDTTKTNVHRINLNHLNQYSTLEDDHEEPNLR
jgi:hypothetical protein